MISREELEGLAQLARLKLTETEAAGLQKDISSILDYVGQLGGGSATIASKDEKEKPLLRNVLREDTPHSAQSPLYQTEESLRAAFPTREGEYNVVRKIIEKDA